MNKLRVCFVKRALEHLQSHNVTLSKPLNGFRILDVGCGGGILSEVSYVDLLFWSILDIGKILKEAW